MHLCFALFLSLVFCTPKERIQSNLSPPTAEGTHNNSVALAPKEIGLTSPQPLTHHEIDAYIKTLTILHENIFAQKNASTHKRIGAKFLDKHGKNLDTFHQKLNTLTINEQKILLEKIQKKPSFKKIIKSLSNMMQLSPDIALYMADWIRIRISPPEPHHKNRDALKNVDKQPLTEEITQKP